MDDERFLEGSRFDRKARYVPSVNPLERSIRDEFRRVDIMQDLFEGTSAEDLPILPNTAEVIKQSGYSDAEWNYLVRTVPGVLEDYEVYRGGGECRYRWDLPKLLAICKSMILAEYRPLSEIRKEQAAIARARLRGSRRGHVASEETKQRMSAAQKKRYAQARLKRENT